MVTDNLFLAFLAFVGIMEINGRYVKIPKAAIALLAGLLVAGLVYFHGWHVLVQIAEATGMVLLIMLGALVLFSGGTVAYMYVRSKVEEHQRAVEEHERAIEAQRLEEERKARLQPVEPLRAEIYEKLTQDGTHPQLQQELVQLLFALESNPAAEDKIRQKLAELANWQPQNSTTTDAEFQVKVEEFLALARQRAEAAKNAATTAAHEESPAQDATPANQEPERAKEEGDEEEDDEKQDESFENASAEYYAIPLWQRLCIGAVYLGLAGALTYGLIFIHSTGVLK